MPNSTCSVFSCKNGSKTSSLQNDNVSYHPFPKDQLLSRHKWIHACANPYNWTLSSASTICSDHFHKSCFVTLAGNKKKLIEGSMPTLNLPQGRPSLVSTSGSGSCSYKIVYNTEPPLKIENQPLTTSTAAHLVKPCGVSKPKTTTAKSISKTHSPDLARLTKLKSNQHFTIPNVVPKPAMLASNSTNNTKPQDTKEITKLEKQRLKTSDVVDPLSSLRVPKPIMVKTEPLDTAEITKLDNEQSSIPLTANQTVDTSKSETTTPQLNNNKKNPDTGRIITLKNRLNQKNIQIKRLQTQNGYLKKKLKGLQDLLKEIKENILDNKEDRALICKVGAYVENWCRHENQPNKKLQSNEDEK